MQVIESKPPNYAVIAEHFGEENISKACFAYGDKIFNLSGAPITDDLMVHESVHSRQQQEIGLDQWWDKYLQDNNFRISQEAEAYGEQYKFYCSVVTDRNDRFKMLHRIAVSFSGPMYGGIISYTDAKNKIMKYSTK